MSSINMLSLGHGKSELKRHIEPRCPASLRVQLDAGKIMKRVPATSQQRICLAFIAGLSGFGLIPQAVLQIPGVNRGLID
jgi:hypothetical protein